jgi:hypothetical protein
LIFFCLNLSYYQYTVVDSAAVDEQLLKKLLSRTAQLDEIVSQRDGARVNILHEQSKYKKRYDEKRKPPTYKPGDKVLESNARKATRKGGKMDDNFTGPHL